MLDSQVEPISTTLCPTLLPIPCHQSLLWLKSLVMKTDKNSRGVLPKLHLGQGALGTPKAPNQCLFSDWHSTSSAAQRTQSPWAQPHRLRYYSLPPQGNHFHFQSPGIHNCTPRVMITTLWVMGRDPRAVFKTLWAEERSAPQRNYSSFHESEMQG